MCYYYQKKGEIMLHLYLVPLVLYLKIYSNRNYTEIWPFNYIEFHLREFMHHS